MCAADARSVSTFPEFIQRLDDDIVSLTAMTLICDSKSRHHSECRNHCSDYVAVSDDSVSAEAASLSDVTISDTRLH